LIALADCVKYLLCKFVDLILFIIKKFFELVWLVLKAICRLIGKLIPKRVINYFERIKRKLLPTENLAWQLEATFDNGPVKRSITYYAIMVLAMSLYIFVYIVLIKHHTIYTVIFATLLGILYYIAVDNSHQIRSILILCLPIMFTNRGRALIFCSMLSELARGPLNTLHHNVHELHGSLRCCKQYLIIKADKYVDKNVVKKLIVVEKVIDDLIENIKKFSLELREKVEILLSIALTIEDFALKAIKELKKIAVICELQSEEIIHKCYDLLRIRYRDCRSWLLSPVFSVCDLILEVESLCATVKLPSYMCSLPYAAVQYIDETLGERLRSFLKIIENELYVSVKASHNYSLESTKTKDYETVIKEIGADVADKFWYVHLINRMFNLISLILVIWILGTATLYQMHYLTEPGYDNIYLDDSLKRYEQRLKGEKRKKRSLDEMEQSKSEVRDEFHLIDLDDESERDELMSVRSLVSIDDEELTARSGLDEADDLLNLQDTVRSSIEEEPPQEAPNLSPIEVEKKEKTEDQQQRASLEGQSVEKKDHHPKRLLFPMTRSHKQHYLQPFSLRMADTEKTKLKIAGLVWLIICAYISFFLFADFTLFELISMTVKLLKDILFAEELPIVSVGSKSENGTVVRYNRTQLRELRNQMANVSLQIGQTEASDNSTIQQLYRRLMFSLEKNIPHDIELLDSLEACLPKPQTPSYRSYRWLLYMALLTFGAVFLEAYALRLRHWIANLFYPKQAQRRTRWLYEKLLEEKPLFEDDEDPDEGSDESPTKKQRLLDIGLNLLLKRIK